jgi:hypothetical protein
VSILRSEIEQVRRYRIIDAIFHLRAAANCLVAADVSHVGDSGECPDVLLMQLADALQREHVERSERVVLAARVEEVW